MPEPGEVPGRRIPARHEDHRGRAFRSGHARYPDEWCGRFSMTDDDGAIESGHPPDPDPAWAARPSSPRPPRPACRRHPARRLRVNPRPPLPSFGVAHPATPGPASPPAHSPASPPSHDPLSVPLTGATAAGPAVPAPASSAGPAARPPPIRPPPLHPTAPLPRWTSTRSPARCTNGSATSGPPPGYRPGHAACGAGDHASRQGTRTVRPVAKIAQEKAATSNYVQRAPYEVPERLAQSGGRGR